MPERLEEQVIASLELLRGYDRSIVLRPTLNNRVELSDDLLLRERLALAHYHPEFLQMALDSFFTRFDQRLETKWSSFVRPCMGFPYRELPDGVG